MAIDVGTAGSATLVLQALVPVCLRLPKPVTLEITGGTHVAWSPPFDYFRRVLCPALEKMGIKIESEIISYGFYPKGGGRVRTRISPCPEIKPITLTQREGEPKVYGLSMASDFLKRGGVAERQLEGANVDMDKTEIKYVSSLSPGSCMYMEARYGNSVLASSSLGERGKPAERVGQEAAKELYGVMKTEAVADKYLADQLIPYMALAGGSSRILAPELSKHTETNIWVVKKFLDVDFKMEKKEGGVLIECSGSPCH
jgi:RNA 3'-phosphate cyclase